MKHFLIVLTSFIIIPSLSLAEVCSGYGPQTPRDISNDDGENQRIFEEAPDADELNLCNIHFHKQAEHKGPNFSVLAGEGDFRGYQCNKTKSLDSKLLKPSSAKGCENLDVGDTIEIHWVHTSCDIEPGPGLGSCLSDKCANPQLRVEAQVYVLVNSRKALQLGDYNLADDKDDGYFQAAKLPRGSAVEFLGSTTGPSYSDSKCSPLQVTWNVRKSCKEMDINSVHAWCENNKFAEKKPHGVRKLVVDPSLLSEID